MKCPGQDSQYWDGSAIFEVKCPACGHSEELFKDESSKKCKNCGSRIANPKMDFGCASYCKFADQCLGELPKEILTERENRLKNRVAEEMKTFFGSDIKRIQHANKVVEYAEKIAKEIKADMAVVYAAAYLHDIGIKDAELKYNSNSAEYQETLGPDIARKILTKLNADKKLINEVCDIIGHHHHPRDNESVNFKAVYDADQIVNIEEKKSNTDAETTVRIIEKKFLTDFGRQLAKTLFL